MPRVVHFESTANEPEKVVDFYQKVFGWKVTKWEGPQEYWLVETGEAEEPGINGGIMRSNEVILARLPATKLYSRLSESFTTYPPTPHRLLDGSSKYSKFATR